MILGNSLGFRTEQHRSYVSKNEAIIADLRQKLALALNRGDSGAAIEALGQYAFAFGRYVGEAEAALKPIPAEQVADYWNLVRHTRRLAGIRPPSKVWEAKPPAPAPAPVAVTRIAPATQPAPALVTAHALPAQRRGPRPRPQPRPALVTPAQAYSAARRVFRRFR